MLSFAETDLVHRDHAIPGLAMVLDPDTFATALRRAAPDADLRTAQITYRRYKPQNFCRVAYRLDVAGAELDLDVRACRPDAAVFVWTGYPANEAIARAKELGADGCLVKPVDMGEVLAAFQRALAERQG